MLFQVGFGDTSAIGCQFERDLLAIVADVERAWTAAEPSGTRLVLTP